MEFNLDEFVKAPTLEVFNKCTKEHLLLVSEHFNVSVPKQAKKKKIKDELLIGLVQIGVFPATVLPKEQRGSSSDASVVDDAVRLKELEVELGRIALREKELHVEQMKVEKDAEIRLRELELSAAGLRRLRDADFDVSKNIRLVPPFNERDVDKYFTLFERVALTLKWPRDAWSLLLQCTLVGKAQEAYASLPVGDCLDFDKVKHAVLRAYELVPEAYRQRFRRLRKQHDQTYVEFVRDKEVLFDRWCSSQKVTNFSELKQLLLMEEFKNSLSEKVTTYLNEQKEMDVSKAAVLVDEYVLTHKCNFFQKSERSSSFNKSDRFGGSREECVENPPVEPVASVAACEVERAPDASEPKTNENVMCFYCKKKGHIVASCPVLQKRNAKPVALIKTVNPVGLSPLSEKPDCAHFNPFIMNGFVAVSNDGERVPVKILRDTASAQSFILEGVLPLNTDTAVGFDVPVRGFNMQEIGVPLHKVVIQSDLWSGDAVVGLRPRFPINGVSVIMGNDLAGGRVLVTPEVIPVLAVRGAAERAGDAGADLGAAESDAGPVLPESEGSVTHLPDVGVLSVAGSQFGVDPGVGRTSLRVCEAVTGEGSEPVSADCLARVEFEPACSSRVGLGTGVRGELSNAMIAGFGELSGAEPVGDVLSGSLAREACSSFGALKYLPLWSLHLGFAQSTGVIGLIQSGRSLSAEIPTHMCVPSRGLYEYLNFISLPPYGVDTDKWCRQWNMEYMVKHGIAAYSGGAWNSLCLPLSKAAVDVRVMDVWKICGVTGPDGCPLPPLEGGVSVVGPALALLGPLCASPCAHGVLAFVMPDDFPLCAVVASGMCASPVCFQPWWCAVLSGHLCCEDRFGGWISSGQAEHFGRLGLVFARVGGVDLNINPSKFEFG